MSVPNTAKDSDELPLGTARLAPRPFCPHGVPEAIRPYYNTPTLNAPVELYAGKIELERSTYPATGQGTICLAWSPRPMLRFSTTGWDGFDALKLFVSDFGPARLRVEGSNLPLDCRITSYGEFIEGRCRGRFQELPPMKLAKVVFHLANWGHVQGSGVGWENGHEVVFGRLTLEAEGWRVFIDPVRGLNKLEAEFSRGGGYAITHVGQIERADRTGFSAAEADEFLKAIHYFLSFARGFWTPPILPVALNEHGDVVHREWELHDITSWRFVHSWFTDRDGTMLQRLFPGFLRRWKEEAWGDALRRAIWWYIAANTQAGGCDGAVILAQVALELLAWVVYVEQGHIVSERGFEDLPGADKLRLLIAWLKLDLGTPAKLTALAAFGRQDIPYGPYKLVEIRNALVHPKNRDKLDDHTDAIIECWQLALWYCELAMLRACDYDGPYVDRLNVRYAGEVQPVPWGNWKPVK